MFIMSQNLKIYIFSFFLVLNPLFFIDIFASEMDCKNVIEKDGIYYLKYTFVKFNGICKKFDKTDNLIQKQSFINGEKNGEFISYEDSIVVEKFFMKDNEPHGVFEGFKNHKLFKKIEYIEGEVKKCLIDILYIMEKEKEIIELKKSEKTDDKIRLTNLMNSVNDEKMNCDVKNLN